MICCTQRRAFLRRSHGVSLPMHGISCRSEFVVMERISTLSWLVRNGQSGARCTRANSVASMHVLFEKDARHWENTGTMCPQSSGHRTSRLFILDHVQVSSRAFHLLILLVSSRMPLIDIAAQMTQHVLNRRLSCLCRRKLSMEMLKLWNLLDPR